MVDIMNIKSNNPARKKYIINLLHDNMCFVIYLKEETSETPSHEMSVFTNRENENNTLASYPTKPHINEGLARER